MSQSLKTTLRKMNTFQYSLFGHFEQQANEMLYLGRPVNAPFGYQILLSCNIKWPNNIYACVPQVMFSQIGS